MENIEKAVIDGNIFYEKLLNNQINGRLINNIKINCNSKSSISKFENYIFENIIFKNVDFIAANFNQCSFINCSFIECLFFDTDIIKNNFIKCYFDNIIIGNNASLVQNRFEQVTGNIGRFNAQAQENNYFFNMNFDGFISLYSDILPSGTKKISCRRNYFKNTTISLSALEALSNTTDILVGAYKDFSNRFNRLIECETDGNNVYDVRHMIGTLDYYNGIDMKNMSHESRLNLIASVFTKYHIGELYNIIEIQDNSFKGNQLLHHYTIDNPLPIIVVNDKGHILKNRVIEDINYKINNPVKWYEFCLTPGEQILKYNNNNLLNPDNYTCKKLIKK